MTRDETPRWIKIGDAFSQLLNVLLLARHKETTANESVSGRAHRSGWKKTEWTINLLFRWMEKDHCRVAHMADVARARALLNAEEARGRG